jgi:hypothetical protein
VSRDPLWTWRELGWYSLGATVVGLPGCALLSWLGVDW